MKSHSILFMTAASVLALCASSPAWALTEEEIDQTPDGTSLPPSTSMLPCTDYYDFEDGYPQNTISGHVYCAINVPPSAFDNEPDAYAHPPDSFANESASANLCSQTTTSCKWVFVGGKKQLSCTTVTAPAPTPEPWEVGWRKSFVVGNDFFGAGIFLNAFIGAIPGQAATDSSPEVGDKMYAETSLRHPVTVFHNTKDYVYLLAEANAEYGHQAYAHALVVLGGVVYYEDSGTQSLSMTKSFQRDLVSASATFTFGPIPATVTGKVRGAVGITGAVGPKVTAAGTGVGAEVTPYATATATASLAVGVTGLQAGIEGQLEIIHVGVPSNGSLVMDSTGKLSWGLNSDVEVRTLDGSLNGYIEVLNRRYRRKLVDWDGFSTTIPLFHLGNCQSIL